MIESEEYQRGYRDGYAAARRADRITPTQPADWKQCSVCGMTFDGVMGYVCPNPKCPSGVQCK